MTSVCRRFGISPRTLHNLFADGRRDVRGHRARVAARPLRQGAGRPVDHRHDRRDRGGTRLRRSDDVHPRLPAAFRQPALRRPRGDLSGPCTECRGGVHALPGLPERRPAILPSTTEASRGATTMTVSFLLTPEQEQLKAAARSFARDHLRDLAAAVRAEPDPLTRALLLRPDLREGGRGGVPQGPDPGAVRRRGGQRRRRRDLRRGVGRGEPGLRHLDGRPADRADARLPGGHPGADRALRRALPGRLRRTAGRHGLQRARGQRELRRRGTRPGDAHHRGASTATSGSSTGGRPGRRTCAAGTATARTS